MIIYSGAKGMYTFAYMDKTFTAAFNCNIIIKENCQGVLDNGHVNQKHKLQVTVS